MGFAATITAGQTLSNAVGIDLSNFTSIMGLEIPTLATPSVVYLKVATSSDGTFRRLLKADGSEDWNIASSSGDRIIFIDEAAPFRWFKVELGTAQAGDVTFNLLLNKSIR